MVAGITLLIVSIVCIIIGVTVKQNGGTDVLCPKCKSRVHIPEDGSYICPNCNHKFVYGKNDKIKVICPSCKNDLFIDGAGIHTCPKCNNDFSYLEHTGVPVKCPNCLKIVFVNGTGKIRCQKCNAEFNYGQQNNNTNNLKQVNNDYKKYYDVLGCSYNASDDEINQKYKEMSMKFHPDKLVSKDLPEELIQFSTNKFIEIQDAYEKIKVQKADSYKITDAKTEYLVKWGLIKEGVKIKYSKILYYKGNPLIDAKGNYFNKPFYLWIDNNIIFLLDANFNNSIGLFKIDIKDISSYFLSSSEKKVTFINLYYNKKLYTFGMDYTVYDTMLEHYPAKDLAYIKQQKIG